MNLTSLAKCFWVRGGAPVAVARPRPVRRRPRGKSFSWPRLAALAATVALVESGAAAAVLEGRVALPPGRTAPVANQRYEIVSNAGVLATNPPLAVVYLEGNFPRPGTLPVREIVQKDLVFVPSLLAVQVGTRVEFPNLDPTYHNIFSFSRAKRFDLGRYRTEDRPVPSQVFDVPGLVTLRCDIHEHMRALILVLDTPHFVVTAADGSYRLENVPAGRYVLKAWLDSRTTREHQIELEPDSVRRVDFP